MTTNPPTYNKPGPCPKCGCYQSWVEWYDSIYQFGVGGGELKARCDRCRYSWKVQSKDECDR